MPNLPLRQVRVLDFTRHLPGPFATDLLCRLGAEVLKVEPPDGDPTRWIPPFDGDYSALFNLVNSGKESVVIDLKKSEGRELVGTLAEQVDVVVESYRPGVAAAFGIDAKRLRAINPRLVHCSISGFGSANPRSAHDLNFVALAGLLDLQRDAQGQPILPSTQIGDMAGALFGALTILAALLEQQRSGGGATIEVSMADATRALMPTAESLYRGTHHTPESFMLTGALPSYNVYQTADGKHIAVATLEPHFWEVFCNAVGLPDLISKQYVESAKNEVFATLRTTIASRTREEWERIFAAVDACVEPVLTIEEAHERLGDPMESHPLQRNFPSPPRAVPRLGDAFERAIEIARIDGAERTRLERSGAFQARERLKKFIAKTADKLRRI